MYRCVYLDGDRVTLINPSNKVIASCEKLGDGKITILKGSAATTSSSSSNKAQPVVLSKQNSNSLKKLPLPEKEPINEKKRKSATDSTATSSQDTASSLSSKIVFGNTPKRKRGIPITNTLGTQNPEVHIESVLDNLVPASSPEAMSSAGKTSDHHKNSNIAFKNLRSSDLILRDGRRISDSSANSL